MIVSPRVPVLVIAGVSSGAAKTTVTPAAVRMQRDGLAIGYREVEVVASNPLGPPGAPARGPRPEGFVVARALMSYVHLHLGSDPALARNFVSACATRW